MEYAWFNNVESKPRRGLSKRLGNQDMEGWLGSKYQWKKSFQEWVNRIGVLAKIFNNPDMP